MNKAKKLLPVKLSDCKKAYEKDGKNRYVIIDSLAIQVPIFLCKTCKEAEEQIKWFREMGLYPSSIIVDLEEYGEWKSAYDKEPICKGGGKFDMKKVPTLFERVYKNHCVFETLPNVTKGMESRETA